MIDHIDHVVLTTRDLQRCVHFYGTVLGMRMEKYEAGGATRIAFRFGQQKINVHEWGKEFSPRAHVAAPGTLDLCFIASVELDAVIAKLSQSAIPIIDGPIDRTGATGRIRSVYVRDPDLNLIEISVLQP